MLELSLRELAISLAFSSERMSSELLEYCRKRKSKQDIQNLYKRCRTLLVDEVDRHASGRFRLPDIEAICEFVIGHDFIRDRDIPILDELADELFETTTTSVHFYADHTLAYARLCAHFDPTVLAAWHFVRQAETQRHHSASSLLTAFAKYGPMFAPPANGVEYAEHHVHLFGAYGAELRLAHAVLGDVPTGGGSVVESLKAVRELLHHLLNQEKLKDEAEKALEILVAPDTAERLTRPDWDGWKVSPPQGARIDLHWYRHQLALAGPRAPTDQAWLWLFVWIWTCYRATQSAQLRMALLHIVMEITRMRQEIVMRGVGLTRFVQAFDTAEGVKIDTASKTATALSRIFQGEQDLAEVKLGPGKLDSVVAEISHWLAGPIATGEAGQQRRQQGMHRWRGCVHFYRGADKKISSSKPRDDAERLRRALALHPARLSDTSNGVSSSSPPIPSLVADWIYGIDVAGDENTASNESFAPSLRQFRDRYQRDHSPHRLHLSVHAGEDFADLLSGMRRVDETVEFCGMTEGDRLGHALAIGIEPGQWAARQGDVMIDLDEHVDNLVWLWKRSEDIDVDDVPQLRSDIARHLAELAGHLPWADRNTAVQPADLWDAWMLRRNDASVWVEQRQCISLPSEELSLLIPDFQRLRTDSGVAMKCFDSRVRWFAEHKNPSTVARGRLADAARRDDRPRVSHFDEAMPRVQVSYGHHGGNFRPGPRATRIDGLFKYGCPNAQLRLMHAVQDKMLTRYARQGICIEVNLTSNVYISRMKTFEEHPIFRWYPPTIVTLRAQAQHNAFGLRDGVMPIIVNTDDPGLMPTTLRMEFMLLKVAAERLGYASVDIDAWLEALRVKGVQEFTHKVRQISRASPALIDA